MRAAFIRDASSAERRSALLLLLALAIVFAAGSSPGRFHLWTSDHGDVTLNCLTHAANLSPEHGFRRFYYRLLNGAGERVYGAYNPLLPYETSRPTSLPIGGMLLVKAAITVFPDDLAAQFRAARTLMLAFFAGAMVAAYLALKRLTGNPSIALAATLLGFSSFGTLHYADMVGTEGSPDLFGVMLTFHGLVVFAQQRRLPGLLAKIFVAVLIGWHVFALLLPFVVLGLAAEWLRDRRSLLRRTTGLLGSRRLLIGVLALSLGVAVLGLNFAIEFTALASEGSLAADAEEPTWAMPRTLRPGAGRDAAAGAETSLDKLASYRSISRAVGWDPHTREWRAQLLWGSLQQQLFNRAGRASIPYAFERAGRYLFESPPAGAVQAHRGVADDAPGQRWLQRNGAAATARAANGLVPSARHEAGGGLAATVYWWGVVVFAITAIGVARARHRTLMATLAGFGFCWGPLVHLSAAHAYEGLFFVGLPLVFFSLVLMRAGPLLRKHGLSERWIDACAGAALLVFALSGLQVARLPADAEEPSHFRTLLADMEAVRRAAPEGATVVGHTLSRGEMRYLTIGRTLLRPLDGRQRERADFVLSRSRLEDAGLLTAENRFIFLYDRAAQDARYANLGEPVLEAPNGWTVHLLDNRLIVASGAACDRRRDQPMLFVESFPAERHALPFFYYDARPLPRRTEFRFRESGFEVAGRCIAELAPPAYEVGRVRIGQFVPGKGESWSETRSLNWGRLPSRSPSDAGTKAQAKGMRRAGAEAPEEQGNRRNVP